MAIDSMDQLLYEELRDIYNAEKQITQALPKMAKAAQHPDLKKAFTEHLAATKGQYSRLEEIFTLLGKPARGKKCEGMAGLIAEGTEAMEEKMAEPFGDIALIAAAKKIEHYEISGYTSICWMAGQAGHEDVVALLTQTLEEEIAADAMLDELCESLAMEPSDEDDMEDEEEPVSAKAAKATRRK